MDECSQDLLKNLTFVVQNSAHFINRQGSYYQCLQQEGFKYSVIEFGIGKTDIRQYFSLCLPKKCSDESLTIMIDTQFLNLKLPYSVFHIDSSDQTRAQSMDGLSYFVLFLFIALIVLALIATLRTIFQKSKQQQQQKIKRAGILLLQAFDINKNIRHFKNRENQPLNILDGVRALSMMWVVFGHTFLYLIQISKNRFTLEDALSAPFYLLVEGGFLSVDIFFMLSGFFLIFVLMRQKSHNLVLYLMGIFLRILRILPSFILVMLFYFKLFIHTGQGPSWISGNQPLIELCSNMWRQILFVSNLISASESCMGWSWYLQVDFQLFLFGIILFMIYKQNRLAFFVASYLSCILSTAFVVWKTYNIQIKVFTKLEDFVPLVAYFQAIYVKPWGRCTTYIIGMLFGVIYMEHTNLKGQGQQQNLTILKKITNFMAVSKIRRLSLEWTGIFLMALVVFIPRLLQIGFNWPQIVHSFYYGFSKPIFIIALLLAIIPTLLGYHKSFLNTILTAKIFSFISKISFCTYLVHFIVITQFISSRVYNQYYNILDTLVVYFGLLIISLLFGLIATLIIQLPFASLQKNFIDFIKNKKRQNMMKNQSLLSVQQKMSGEVAMSK